MNSQLAPEDVLDPKQLKRIEAVHRGFLYQHLYAVGCLLLAGGHDVRRVSVERDEDVELELADGSHHYLQIKDRAGLLVLSDIAGALQRFQTIRDEHAAGRRAGEAKFVIVSKSPPGPNLRRRIDIGELPGDLLFLWPGAPGTVPDGLPPAWSDVADGFGWCVQLADQLPMVTVSAQTLAWKLAGLVQAASAGQAFVAEAGRVDGHTFHVEQLPALFEQLVVQLQQFPQPPLIYRPVQKEPLLTSEMRVRVISGFSGAGKTAWAAQAAAHNPGETAYYDVGDVPGPAIAASLTRELAAHWAAGSAQDLRAVLGKATHGLDSLRALDKFLKDNGAHALVVLDNAHRVPVADLRMLIDATRHLKIVMLAQPVGAIAELQAQTGVQPELLQGWDLDQAAAEVRTQGARAPASDLGRLIAITGGLPLYVRAAVQLAVRRYDGDVAALCDAVRAGSHLELTAQEVILSGVFDALDPDVRDCVAVLSLSDVPLSEEEAGGVVGKALGLSASGFAGAIRQLTPLGVVRLFTGRRLQIHDALRLLGRRRFDEMPEEVTQVALSALMSVIHESFEIGREISRLPLFVRTLIELDRLDVLTDMATEEWFHELPVGEGVWPILEAAAANPAVDAKIRFDALDALLFSAAQAQRITDARRHLTAMNPLLAAHYLGRRRNRVYLLKKTLLDAQAGDEVATRQGIDQLCAATPPDRDNQRVLSYSIALALFSLGSYGEVLQIVRPLIDEYTQHLGIEPLPLLDQGSGRIRFLIPMSETAVDDIKHLADALDLFAQGRERVHLTPGRSRMFAAHLYRAVNMVNSFVKLSQNYVDELVRRRDHVGARTFIENHVLPTVAEREMHGHLLSVRSQYAVVLGLCGDFDGADSEFKRLEQFEPGLAPEQHREIARQRQNVASMRASRDRPGRR